MKSAIGRRNKKELKEIIYSKNGLSTKGRNKKELKDFTTFYSG